MKAPAATREDKNGLALAGEAANLLCTAPLGVSACYAVGSVPFVVGLLYFWSEMSRSAFAAARCLPEALALAALFVWMKAWQAAFAAGLGAHLRGERSGPWTLRRIRRAALVQAAAQPFGLVLIPLALLLMLPFYAVHGFFQNLTVLGDGGEQDLRGLAREAAEQSLLWPKQSHMMLWLLSPWLLGSGMAAAFGTSWLVARLVPDLHQFGDIVWFGIGVAILVALVLPISPFGCVVAANVGVALFLLPGLLHTLLGMETPFSLSGVHAIFNTTFLLSVFGIAYLCMDPLLKAAVVLRCFYGRSLRTGEDLLAEWRELGRDEEAGGGQP